MGDIDISFGICVLIRFGRYVLDQILSGEAAENVVENIHEYLTTVGTNVRSGKVKVDDFIIFKVRALSKSSLTTLIDVIS